jgi:hypothetical protein
MAAVLAAWMAVLGCGGCVAPAGRSAQVAPRQIDAGAGELVLPGELDELTRAFADRYVGLLSSAADALKKDNPDPVQRREAQQVLLNCATNVYDIASNADAFTRMLDLVVVTTLVSQVWIDDDRAWEVFGERGEPLVRALHRGRAEAWALAARVLRHEQLDLIDYLLWDWRRRNPDMVRASFVRLSNFAIGRGKSANAEVLAATGLLANVGQAGQAVAEARLLTERVFYMLKRSPTLLRWQMECAKDEIMATPAVGTYLADMHRLADQVEQLPKNIAAERKAILSAFDDRRPELSEMLVQVRTVIADANTLFASIGRTNEAVTDTLKLTDSMIARSDRPAEVAATESARPFDIREYAEAANALALAAEKINELVKSSDELLGSSDWDRRIQQVSQSADDRIRMASEQSKLVGSDIFWRIYVAMGVLLVMLIICLVTVFMLVRRVRRVVVRAGDA